MRLRLSNGVSAATEFEATDARALRTAVRDAYARHAEHHVRDGTLELHVAPAPDAEARGWCAPVCGRTPVRVLVSRALLDQRPADDWGDVWEWCETARATDAAITALVGWTRTCASPCASPCADPDRPTHPTR